MDDYEIKIGMGSHSDCGRYVEIWGAEIFNCGSWDDFDEDDGGGLVVVKLTLEIGTVFSDAAPSTVWESTSLCHANPGSTPSFPRVITMTTSAQGGALHIAMLLEVCGE